MIANDIGKLFTKDICSFLLTKNFHGYLTGLSFNFATDNKLCDITSTADDQYNVEIYSDSKRIHIYRNLARQDILSTVFNIRGSCMKHIWTSGSGRIELELTSDNIDQGSHCGDCFDDLAALIKMPEISKQFDLINPDVVRTELKAYGAWDEAQLNDKYMNKCRLLWIAAGDLSDEHAR